MERLDKLLARQGLGSRSQVKAWILDGRVTVDGEPCRDSGAKGDPAAHRVALDEKELDLPAFHYGMLNKPPGVLTAASDRRAKTVADLLPPSCKAMGMMPVGRLDKDARGLLLFTTDGPMAHFLLSPKRHVAKEYQVLVDGPLDEADVRAFADGMVFSDFTAQPAKLQIVSSGPGESQALVTVKEGKFHQVKRMFLQRGRTVSDLKRISFGSLRLPGSLAEGGFRELDPAEVEALKRDALGGGASDG